MRLQLDVSGMRCTACIQTLAQAVIRLPGAREPTVEIGCVVVELNEMQTTRADLIAAIQSAGPFDVTGFTTCE